MIKEKRKKERLIKKLLIGLLIFIVLIVIAVFIVVNVFVVEHVEIEGNELYEEQLITDTVLNDEYSWNSLYVLLKYSFVNIKDVPFIDTMEISLLDPQTLHIKVYEKGMLGYLYIAAIGENAYFDKDGFVVETSTRVIENVPKIEGISCDEVVLYEKLPIDNQKLRELLTLTMALKRDDLEPDSIHYGLAQSPILSYGNTEVWMGSIELLTQKVQRLTQIMPNIRGVAGILHMEDWTEESANIIFEKELEMPDVDTGEEGETGSEDEEDASEGNLDNEGDGSNEDETPQDDDFEGEN